uniref:Reverse transcriptase domain-containing protein n=1 Tax=Angiostrongylus cantonensis TaxID=6313 RepID=A0A0K0CZU8_ANGCA
MLADFDEACAKIGLRLNLTKTMFMRNISECSRCVYLGRETNMFCDLAPELSRKKRAAWGARKNTQDIVKRTKNTRFRAYLSDSTVLSAVTYASETLSLRKRNEKSLSVIERTVETTMLGLSRFTQVRDRIRSFDLRQRSKIEDAVLYAKQMKIRYAGHVMCMITDGQGPLVTGFLGMLNALQEDIQLDSQSSLRKA